MVFICLSYKPSKLDTMETLLVVLKIKNNFESEHSISTIMLNPMPN